MLQRRKAVVQSKKARLPVRAYRSRKPAGIRKSRCGFYAPAEDRHENTCHQRSQPVLVCVCVCVCSLPFLMVHTFVGGSFQFRCSGTWQCIEGRHCLSRAETAGARTCIPTPTKKGWPCSLRLAAAYRSIALKRPKMLP